MAEWEKALRRMHNRLLQGTGHRVTQGLPMNGRADVTYYLELQRRLFEIFLYVSCHEDNFGTFSIKLESLFVDICSFLDSLCQTVIRELGSTGHRFKAENSVKSLRDKMSGAEHFDFGDYRGLLEGDFLLSTKELVLNPFEGSLHAFGGQSVSIQGPRIKPFSEWATGKSPDWWRAFTKLKHDRLANARESTLKNVILSLAATFVVLAYRNEGMFKAGSVNAQVYHLFMPTYWDFKDYAFKGQPMWK